MRMKFLLVASFLVCGSFLSAMAQSNWVSVGEMRQFFLDNYKKKVSVSGHIDKRHMTHDGENCNVYVVGCLDEDTTLSVPDIVEAIRRQEYNGYLDELQYPLNYMGSGVSGSRRVVWRLAGEEIMSKTRVAKKPKSLSYECGRNYAGPYISSHGEYMDLAHLGEGKRPYWTQEIRVEMVGLADMINTIWVKEKHDFKTGFFYGGSVLLYVSPEGKMDMEVLLVEDPSPNDEKVFALLRKVVRELPPWAISYLWRTDGKVFPGRYLKCILMPHGVWRIEDYLEDVLYEAKRTDAEAA